MEKMFKKKLNQLNRTENDQNKLASTLEISEEDFMLYNKINRKSEYFKDLIESVDSLDTSLTAAQILNQKIELELQLHHHAAIYFKAF